MNDSKQLTLEEARAIANRALRKNRLRKNYQMKKLQSEPSPSPPPPKEGSVSEMHPKDEISCETKQDVKEEAVSGKDASEAEMELRQAEIEVRK